MKNYHISINIDAKPNDVWSTLTHELAENPVAFGITKLEGKIVLGARIKLWSEIAPDRAFALKVITFDEPRKMVWRGGMPLGLFSGTRTFTLSPRNGGTSFTMDEVFSGPLSGPISRSMPDLNPSFSKFAKALKSKAEAR